MPEFISYCGSPPLPGELVWNLNPVLVAVLGTIGITYGLAAARFFRTSQQLAFIIGWLVLTLALVSPLCNLSVALFSARMGQHILISLVAAPLIVIGGLDVLVLRKSTTARGEPLLASMAFAVALWGWQAPVAYDSTLQNNVSYWMMHLSILFCSLWVWRTIVRSAVLISLPISFFTGMHMTALGALLTLSGRALYTVHFQTTTPWGLSPLEDQQLGGLLMWVPGGLLLAAAFLLPIGFYLGQSSRRQVAGLPSGRALVAKQN